MKQIRFSNPEVKTRREVKAKGLITNAKSRKRGKKWTEQGGFNK